MYREAFDMEIKKRKSSRAKKPEKMKELLGRVGSQRP